ESRMGKSTIYYYFRNKEEIFASVIQKDSLVFKNKLDEVVKNAKTPQEKIGRYVQARMKHLKELTNFYTTLTDEYLEHYLFVEKTRKDFNEYEITTIKTILKDGVSAGDFIVEDIDTSARMIIIALKGLEFLLFAQDNERNIEYESTKMLKILFKGIEKR
ncbi:MAG: TetR/AcrR family transcriptional regulator, partial [archaeon]|nr:TetR/AcrR family transcriptional regulator [archaeon]